MRKVLSIFLVLIMLAAMLHISVATHYCGGKVVSSKVSFTGKLADCGMESSKKELSLPGTLFTKRCCDNVVTFLGVDNNYAPSFSFVPESNQHNFQVFNISSESPACKMSVLKSLYTNGSPPGTLMSTSVDLSDICVFRI